MINTSARVMHVEAAVYVGFLLLSLIPLLLSHLLLFFFPLSSCPAGLDPSSFSSMQAARNQSGKSDGFNFGVLADRLAC